jgi:hypothetical protein
MALSRNGFQLGRLGVAVGARAVVQMLAYGLWISLFIAQNEGMVL